MKPTRLTKIGLGVFGAALFVSIILLLATSGGDAKIGAVKGDGRHCPRCGKELSKSAIAKGECPFCTMQDGPEKGKLKKESSFASSPVIPIVLGIVLGILLVAHITIVLRNRKSGTGEEILYHLRCKKCGRKLRYRPKQIGQLGRCPICQKPIMFPKPEEEPVANRWVKIAHYIWG